ncbi:MULTISPECIES: hypothetical protein [Microcoleaceae]|uniref:hypothetical protein n=2 Tax=Microcoleaceae TaxID=1892252 RepID=UPI0018821A67|nr:hypothetical protein [Tychonema sp. LEGE 06208]MBE9123126.1 hypothetical protein [Tychonema sp. LEGE 07199]MBE9133434.1 hypothetical protein [Tychonema sp. LEGE 07196]MBE9165814.1 hypothetical protein [Tychonema sp. LEGE 06208]
MNVDFIKAQVRLLQGASSSERETLMKNIGVCAGVIRPGEYVTPQRKHAITLWLQTNAVRLRLPQLPMDLSGQKPSHGSH